MSWPRDFAEKLKLGTTRTPPLSKHGMLVCAKSCPQQDSETLELVDPETRRRMQADPMFRVEKTVSARLRLVCMKPCTC